MVCFAAAFLRNRPAWFGVAVITALMTRAVGASVLAPYPPLEPHPADRLVPPSSRYLLGTDDIGRDNLSRIIYGARASLAVGSSPSAWPSSWAWGSVSPVDIGGAPSTPSSRARSTGCSPSRRSCLPSR